MACVGCDVDRCKHDKAFVLVNVIRRDLCSLCIGRDVRDEFELTSNALQEIDQKAEC